MRDSKDAASSLQKKRFASQGRENSSATAEELFLTNPSRRRQEEYSLPNPFRVTAHFAEMRHMLPFLDV